MTAPRSLGDYGSPASCCGFHGDELCCVPASEAPAQGELLRDAGILLVDSAEDPAWKQAADEAILELARAGKLFTADDVRTRAGDPTHANALGARINLWARKGVIRPAGYAKSRRTSRRSSRMLRWLGTPRAWQVGGAA